MAKFKEPYPNIQHFDIEFSGVAAA